MIIQSIEVSINNIERIETELKNEKETLKSLSQVVKSEDMANLNYDQLKFLLSKISWYLDSETESSAKEMLEEKKLIKYPALLKPTYFPEIDKLSISEEEKVRLDKAARNNVRYHIYEKRLSYGTYKGLLAEDVEKLFSLGILTRNYDFLSVLGNSAFHITEDGLNQYKRIWSLYEKDKENSLTLDEIGELDKLLEEYGYGCIELYDIDDDDFYIEITDQESFEKHKKHIEVFYSFVKKPDLTYEML